MFTSTVTTSLASVDCHGCSTLVQVPPRILPAANIVGLGPGQGQHDVNANIVSIAFLECFPLQNKQARIRVLTFHALLGHSTRDYDHGS